MPVIIVAPPRWFRSPLQIFLLCLCIISGLLIMADVSQNKVTREMGNPWASLWGLSLCLGASVAIIGTFWRNHITGMLIERSGIMLLGLASGVWPISILIVTGISSLFTVAVTLIFSVSCFLQVKYINKNINLILEAISHGGHVIE